MRQSWGSSRWRSRRHSDFTPTPPRLAARTRKTIYNPGWSRIEDESACLAIASELAFGAIITGGSELCATHIPFLVEHRADGHAELHAHMARANPQWRTLEGGAETLVVFQGPHAYISPAWYTVHPSVPTWNYVAVHVYGTPRLMNDEETIELLHRSISKFDGEARPAWMAEHPQGYLERMAQAIVGFTVDVTRVEGKAKMSGNRPDADRPRIIDALETTGRDGDAAVAEWMRTRSG